MSTVLLIRHGESQANAGLPSLRPETVELTEKGWQQAEDIAQYLYNDSWFGHFPRGLQELAA